MKWDLENESTRGPAKPTDLTVLSWAGRWGRTLREAVSAPFTARTGIRVHHRTHVGLKLPEDLVFALQRGERPPVDVVWCNGVPAIRAARAGWCTALDQDGETADALGALHHRARPDGLPGWPMVFPYCVQYVLVYRPASFPGGRPRSWDVLLDSRLRGRLAMYPGGNGFYPIAQVMGGGSLADIPRRMEPCWAYLRRLRPQIGTLDYSIGMSELIGQGHLDACFRALPNALGFRDEGQNVDWSIPAEGTTETMDALWVPRQVPAVELAWARRYIAHAISREVQEMWCGQLGVLPVHPQARVTGPLGEDPAFPRSLDDRERILHVSESVKADHEHAWEEQFNAIASEPAVASLRSEHSGFDAGEVRAPISIAENPDKP